MANPQPDEFTRISNELYNAIMQTDFSKRQRNIIDLVIRMSYGCGKKMAILRPVDFELVGVYKTHVGKELGYLAQARVLVMQGDQVALNKNYEEWRISLVRNANQERFKTLIKRNLDSYQNSNYQGNATVMEVTKTVTDGYQNSNYEVTKTVTEETPQPTSGMASGPAERKGKEIKENTCNPTNIKSERTDILTRSPRYNNGQLTIIRRYWNMIRANRKSGKVADSIIAKEMGYWERFPVGIVIEALEIHIRKYQNKQEEYTAGIMRRLVREKGGATNGTSGQSHKPFVLDRSKYLFNGGKDI